MIEAGCAPRLRQLLQDLQSHLLGEERAIALGRGRSIRDALR
jgi:hypothetical protein